MTPVVAHGPGPLCRVAQEGQCRCRRRQLCERANGVEGTGDGCVVTGDLGHGLGVDRDVVCGGEGASVEVEVGAAPARSGPELGVKVRFVAHGPVQPCLPLLEVAGEEPEEGQIDGHLQQARSVEAGGGPLQGSAQVVVLREQPVEGRWLLRGEQRRRGALSEGGEMVEMAIAGPDVLVRGFQPFAAVFLDRLEQGVARFDRDVVDEYQ